MRAMFTRHALDGLRERKFDPNEFGVLFDLLDNVEKAADIPSQLSHFGEVVHLEKIGDEEAFIVRFGDVRAVLSFDPERPEQIIVMSVYRGEQRQAELDKSSVKANASLAEGSQLD